MSGYDPNFLGEKFKIDIPWINYDVFTDVLKRSELRNNYIADYLHYSVVMSRKNRQAYFSICNLDQTKYIKADGRRWFLDERIGEENQLDNRYYKDPEVGSNKWDRGHLTRRTAVTWGESESVARRASNESCSYANACLQHEYFNEDEWRIPEKIAEKMDRDLNGRLSIITGPLFTPTDRWFDPVDFDIPPGRIPSGFWKIIYYIDKKKSEAAGEEVLGCEAYVVDQDQLSIEDRGGAKRTDISTLQITTTELSDLTGIEFPEPLYEANPLWFYVRDDRSIKEPERYEIKVAGKSKGVKKGWSGHVIHDREDIDKHKFNRISQ
jgi:endonuclease G